MIRIIHFMMTGISLQRSLELRFSEPVESDQMARVDVMGNQIRYETVDGVYERSSMVTQRLLKNGSSTLVAGIGVERCTRQPWLVQVE